MADSGNDNAIIEKLAARHGVSEGAVRAVYDALRSSGGRMAQFSHPEFGGMAQWSSGMTMVGDMFNDGMKATLNALASDLADYLHDNPPASKPSASTGSDVSYRSGGQSSSWWPEDFGSPSSTGSQNHLRYAVFPDKQRLVIEDAGKRAVYDTGDHRISGVSQAQSSDATLTFTGQNGLVKISELKKIGD